MKRSSESQSPSLVTTDIIIPISIKHEEERLKEKIKKLNQTQLQMSVDIPYNREYDINPIEFMDFKDRYYNLSRIYILCQINNLHLTQLPKIHQENKIIAIYPLLNHPKDLKNASANIKDNNNIVLQLLEKDGSVIEFASLRLQNTLEYILIAMITYPNAIEYGTRYIIPNNPYRDINIKYVYEIKKKFIDYLWDFYCLNQEQRVINFDLYFDEIKQLLE